MRLRLTIATILLMFVSGIVLAQQAPKQPEMSPQEKAMMDAWMKFATPGDAHKLLDHMTGTFDAKVTLWPAPGVPPQLSTATSEAHWVLGNRYVMESVSGTFMGMPFSGIGYTGYDNAKKEYFNTWMDSMGTGVMTSKGATADNGKTFSFKTSTTDPMTGKDVPGESKMTVVDADHHTMEMWGPAPDGKMFKMMQIDYTRKK